MFYTYVNKLPLVHDVLFLESRERFEHKGGRIYKGRTDIFGNRAFVVMDHDRDVCYRVTKNGLYIQYGKLLDYEVVFVKNREVLYVPFTTEWEQEEVNAFISTIRKTEEAYRRRRSLVCVLRNIIESKANRYALSAGIVYAIATVIVLIVG